MTRCLLSACLCAAVLPVAAGAKPPDLPLTQDYYVTPQVPNDWADWVMPLVPPGAEPAVRHCAGAILMPDEPPATAILPWLFQLSPTPRRELASCLLLVAHPLLLLMPTEQLLDTPADHPCPSGPATVPQPMGPLGQKLSPAPHGEGQGTVLLNERNFDGLSIRGENQSSASVRRIEDCLGRPVTLSFMDISLRQVIEDLRDRFGINVYMDVRAFEEGGIRCEDCKVNVKLEKVSLRSALDLILRPFGLTFVVKDDVLQITTPACARGKLQTKLYAVKDLLRRARPEAPEAAPCPEEQLIKLIASTVAPESWREMGGQGVIEYFPATKTLVINQTEEIQEQVAELLVAVRRVKDRWEEEKRQADAVRAAVRVEGLLKACRTLHETGNDEQAGRLAAEAFALDADKVLDDPLVSQIYLRVRQQSKYQGCPAEKCSEPCGVCPAGYGRKECEPAAPIQELLQPSVLPVDPKVVKPLEVIEEEAERAGAARPDRLRDGGQ